MENQVPPQGVPQDSLLSPHFHFYELTVTEVRQFQDENKIKALGVVPVLTRVALELLEPIREQYGVVIVNSGFRCPDLNSAIGGSVTSQHMVGEAADIKILGMDDPEGRMQIIEWIFKTSGIKFHQLLDEAGCIHISLPKGTNDGQVKYGKPDPNNPGHWITTQLSI